MVKINKEKNIINDDMDLEETMADLPFLPDSSKTKPCLNIKPSKRAKEVMSND